MSDNLAIFAFNAKGCGYLSSYSHDNALLFVKLAHLTDTSMMRSQYK